MGLLLTAPLTIASSWPSNYSWFDPFSSQLSHRHINLCHVVPIQKAEKKHHNNRNCDDVVPVMAINMQATTTNESQEEDLSGANTQPNNSPTSKTSNQAMDMDGSDRLGCHLNGFIKTKSRRRTPMRWDIFLTRTFGLLALYPNSHWLLKTLECQI